MAEGGLGEREPPQFKGGLLLYIYTLYYTTLHYTILRYTILYYTILHYTIYYTILMHPIGPRQAPDMPQTGPRHAPDRPQTGPRQAQWPNLCRIRVKFVSNLCLRRPPTGPRQATNRPQTGPRHAPDRNDPSHQNLGTVCAQPVPSGPRAKLLGFLCMCTSDIDSMD